MDPVWIWAVQGHGRGTARLGWSECECVCVCECVGAFVCAQAALSSPSPSDGGPRQSPVWFGDSRCLAPGSQQPPGCQHHQTMLLSQGRLPNSPTAPSPNPSLPLRYPSSPWAARKSFFFASPGMRPPLCCGVPAGVAQPPSCTGRILHGVVGRARCKAQPKVPKEVKREPCSSVTPKSAFALSTSLHLCSDPAKPTLPGLPVRDPLGQKLSSIFN